MKIKFTLFITCVLLSITLNAQHDPIKPFDQKKFIHGISNLEKNLFFEDCVYDSLVQIYNNSFSGQSHIYTEITQKQDGYGNLIERNVINYNPDNSFSSSFKSSYFYDNLNRRNEVINETINYNLDVTIRKVVNYFDGNTSLVDSIYFYLKNGQSFEFDQKYVNSYDGANNLIETISYSYMNGSWTKNAEFVNTYSNTNKILKATYSYLVSGSFVTQYMQEYSYNTEDSLQSYLVFNGSPLDTTEMTIYSYQNSGKTILSNQYINLTTENLEHWLRDSSTYDQANRILNRVVYVTGTQRANLSLFEYDADYNCILSKKTYGSADFSLQDLSLEFEDYFYYSTSTDTKGAIESKQIPKIYPNPVQNELRIEAQKSNYRLEIYSSIGALISQQNIPALQNTTIDVSAFPAGWYVVKMSSKSGQVSQKIIKE